MRKKLAAGVLAAVGVVALGVGGTYASFTATQAAPEFMAEGGTLELRLTDGADATTPSVSFTGIQPDADPPTRSYRQSQYHYFVKLTNDGTISGRVQWGFADVFERENGCVPPELVFVDPDTGLAAPDTTCTDPSTGPSDSGELGDQLQVLLSVMAPGVCAGAPLGSATPRFFTPTADRSLKDLQIGPTGGPISIDPGGSRCVKADVYFPDDAANNVTQSDSSQWRFRFALTS